MKEFFVQLAFDFKNPGARDYDRFEVALGQIYLTRRLDDGHKIIPLPFNTFAGYLRGQNAQEVIDRVGAEFHRFSWLDDFHGRYFITATLKDASKFDGDSFKFDGDSF